MPKVYRSMRKADDDKPVVEASAKGLGVRAKGKPDENDVNLDEAGNVVLDGKGMSVSPSWRDLPPHRIPKRLKDRFPPARGSNDVDCFTMGAGPFRDEALSERLALKVGRPKHGNVVPQDHVSLGQFEADLAATRPLWVVDEA